MLNLVCLSPKVFHKIGTPEHEYSVTFCRSRSASHAVASQSWKCLHALQFPYELLNDLRVAHNLFTRVAGYFVVKFEVTQISLAHVVVGILAIVGRVCRILSLIEGYHFLQADDQIVTLDCNH